MNKASKSAAAMMIVAGGLAAALAPVPAAHAAQPMANCSAQPGKKMKKMKKTNMKCCAAKRGAMKCGAMKCGAMKKCGPMAK